MVPRNYGYILKLKHRGDCQRKIACVFTSVLNKHSKCSASEAEQALLYPHCLLEAPCALTQGGECRLDLHSLRRFHAGWCSPYKGVVRQHPGLKGRPKHFLLQGPAAQAHIRLLQSISLQTKVGNGCILVSHCELVSQCFGTWCLWEGVSIHHVSCHRGKKARINSDPTSPNRNVNS